MLYSGGMHYDAVDTDADGGRGGSSSDAAYTMSAGHPGLGSSALHRSPCRWQPRTFIRQRE